ncbi:MAG: hypothetical protein LRY57_04680 [Alphaproteobacteria bacterium]|nr:hypothetical protein [Alphaproteobacteria bacterium]
MIKNKGITGMLICNCNPFNEDDVKAFLKDKKGLPVTLSEVYRECSGGAAIRCGIACIPRLTDIIEEHNRAIEVNNGTVAKILDVKTLEAV